LIVIKSRDKISSMNSLIQKAFTLIELLVVIAVIGILSGLIVVSMNGVTNKATIAKAQIFSNSLRNALMANLVSEWRLDGNANDSWNGGNNGSIVGATQISTDCIQESCYSFNATNNNYINIAHNDNLKQTNKITVSIWANTTNWSSFADSRLISCTESGEYNITLAGNNITAWVHINGVYRSPAFTTNSLNSGWHYFVFTYNNRYLKTYLDGVYQNQYDALVLYPIYYLNSNSLIIGGEAGSGSSPAGNYFTGSIDEVRIFSDSLPSSLIKEHYYLGLNNLLTSKQIDMNGYINNIKNIAIK